MKVLLLNHNEQHCGIYQFAANIWKAIRKYGTYNWHYSTVANTFEYWNIYEEVEPDVIIYNFFPSTMPWLADDITAVTRIKSKTIGICHEQSQIEALKSKFDAVIFPDPHYIDDGFVFHSGRLVPEYEPDLCPCGTPGECLNGTVGCAIGNWYPPTIGTFGFGFGNKGNYRLVDAVQDEFNDAKIRLHMSFAAFGDREGSQAKYWAEECRKRITKPGIQLEITHRFMPTTKEVLDFLAGHTLNVFLYDAMPSRGISSTIDYALAAGRPIAISASNMFDHIKHLPIIYPDHSLKSIIERGPKTIEPLRQTWSPQNLVKRYETILSSL